MVFRVYDLGVFVVHRQDGLSRRAESCRCSGSFAFSCLTGPEQDRKHSGREDLGKLLLQNVDEQQVAEQRQRAKFFSRGLGLGPRLVR
jgi:hypothetical protein